MATAKLAFCRVSAAFTNASKPQAHSILEPPLERKGKFTPVRGRISTVPSALKMVCTSKIPAAVHDAMAYILLRLTGAQRMSKRAKITMLITHISAIISPSGKIIQPTPWWEPAVIEGSIPLRDDITFFVSHGDITGRVCTFIFLLMLLALAVQSVTKK